jgi:hypothetical protein
LTKILQYENSKIGTCDAFCVLILKTRNTIYVSNYLSTYLRYLITFHSHIPVTNLLSTTLDYRETDASRGNKYLKNDEGRQTATQHLDDSKESVDKYVRGDKDVRPSTTPERLHTSKYSIRVQHTSTYEYSTNVT